MLHYPKNLRGLDTIVYFLVYLPFDLYSLRFREERMAGLDGSIFKRDFEAAFAMPIGNGFRLGTAMARIARAIAKVRRSFCILYFCWTVSLLYMWQGFVYGKFYSHFYGKFDACTNSVYQALSPPSPQRAWGRG